MNKEQEKENRQTDRIIDYISRIQQKNRVPYKSYIILTKTAKLLEESKHK